MIQPCYVFLFLLVCTLTCFQDENHKNLQGRDWSLIAPAGSAGKCRDWWVKAGMTHGWRTQCLSSVTLTPAEDAAFCHLTFIPPNSNGQMFTSHLFPSLSLYPLSHFYVFVWLPLLQHNSVPKVLKKMTVKQWNKRSSVMQTKWFARLVSDHNAYLLHYQLCFHLDQSDSEPPVKQALFSSHRNLDLAWSHRCRSLHEWSC